MVKYIYWAYFIVAAASHIFVILMIGGTVSLAISTPVLGFWLKGMLFGIAFYSSMYAINHITNKDSFCVLTDLENHYRKQGRMPIVKEFTPRFYSHCRIIIHRVLKVFKRNS